MSCQQATRFITNTNCKNVVTAKNNINIINCSSNNNNSISYSNNNNNIFIKSKQFSNILQPEDPYVFTESVPTTPPPILFNAQKSRTRLNDTTITITKINTQQQQQQQKPQTAAATSPVNSAAVVVTVSKHQQTPSTTTTILSSPPPTSPASQPTIKNVNNKKITATLVKTQASLQTTANANRQNVTQSLKKIATQIVATSNVNKKLSNVCIVRPQLQQTQQQQPYHHYPHSNYITSIDDDDDGGQLKTAVSLSSSSSSSPPPPLYTPPTPSLWQTPLLLDDCIKKESISIKNNAFLHVAPLTGAADSAIAAVASNCNSNNSTTTAMAKVAPIVVHASPPTNQQQLQQCLPPSKFHNHTLAQHLQKLECLKKSKAQNQENILSQETSTLNNDLKSNLSIIPPTHTATTVTSSSSPPSAATLAQCDTIATIKHSETEDLIEIPVNVIYRTTLDSQPPPPPPPPLALQSSCDKNPNNDRQPLTNANYENSIRSTKFIKKSPILEPIKSKNLHANNKTNKSDLATVPTTNNVTATITTAAAKTNPSSIQQIKSFSGNDSVTIPNNITNILENSNGNHQPSLHKRSLNVMTTTTQSRATTTTSATVATNKRKSITAAQCQGTAASSSLEHPAWQMATTTTKGAVAIVKMSPNDLDADISHLATISGLPYCLQYQWLKPLDYLKPFAGKIKEDKTVLPREERIRLYKQQLHRQAVQFLSIRSLQKLPLQVARKRLISVDRLLRKYKENHLNLKLSPPAHLKRCIAADCNHNAIQMADHCQRHIIANETQHIFAPCTAKFADNTQCRMPVFSVITRDMPLCPEHARKRDAYNRLVYEQRPRKMNTLVTKPQQQQQHQQQQHQQHLTIIPTTMTMKNETKQYVMMSQQKSQLTTSRKRKNATIDASGNPVGRPVQKRYKKSMETSQPSQHNNNNNNAIASIATMRLPATQLKRKASTTSLESITSNSQHSSASSTLDSNNVSNSTSQQLFNIISNSSLNSSVTTHNKSTLPPALAPLSGFVPNHMLSFGHDNYNKQQQQQHSQPQQYCAVNNRNNANNNSNISKNNSNPKISIDLKDFMSSQFVQQYRNSTEQQQQHHHHHQQPTNNVNTSAANSSDVNFLNTNSNSNFTGTSGMGSTTSLHTSVADDFLTQDMLSICENSSASSVDTGLGGLSDPELMLGGADDDMPLGDTHLLEEHDLANVLNSLPEDAFQELFTAVHQEESDEIERAIELADKHLKKLQQTIGSELGDFLDFSDDMLLDNGVGGCSEADIDGICSMSPTANSMMDTRNLFMSGGGLGGNAAAVVAASIANS